VVGLCTAYYALKAGHRVTLLERGGPDHQGCSLGNAGMVVPSHFVPVAAPGMVSLGLRMLMNRESPFAIRPRLDPELIRWGAKFMRSCTAAHVERSGPLLRDLSVASRRAYEELEEEIGDFGLVKRGLLMLCKTPEALREETHLAEKARELGLSATPLSPEEAAELDPDIDMDIAGAVHFADDCHLNPGWLMAALANAVERAGGAILWCTEVTGWRTDTGRVAAAKTTTGEVAADEFVIAGGSWSPGLVRELGIRLPMQAGKGYSLTLSNPSQLPRLCSILVEARVAVTPMGESLRFGGTMEVGGLDLSVNQARVNGILKSIPRYFPAFTAEDFAGVPVWSGLRPCSPDGLPYVGRFGGWSNLSAATGHAMMGVSLGPITGKLMATMLSDQTPEITIDSLSPDRHS
jgi:D-amino-acid dehydrogenase